MDNFYDINDFVTYLIKRWKVCLIIVFGSALLFSGSRAVSLIQDFQQQEKEVENIAVSSNKQEEVAEPMWNRVQQIIKIGPTYREIDGEKIDITPNIIDAYRRFGSSEKLLNSMYDTWYEKQKKEDSKWKEHLHEYGYILDKEKNYPYVKKDFYSQFMIDGNGLIGLSKSITEENRYKDYVSVGYLSSNLELAKQISEDYAKQLTELIKKEMGDFQAEIVDVSVLYDLPTRSDGTQTTRVLEKGSSSTVNLTITMIIKQIIKGFVWGGIIGVLVTLVIGLMMYMLTRKINVLTDLIKFGMPVLAVGFKNGSHKFRAKVYSMLEGKRWDSNLDKLTTNVDKIFAIKNKGISIWVVGSGKQETLQQFVEKMNGIRGNLEYNWTDNIYEMIDKKNAAVVLVEEFGVSMKNEIKQEIQILQEHNISILGIVGLE